MAETSHDAKVEYFHGRQRTQRVLCTGRALSAVIIKYSNNKGLVRSALLGMVVWRCVILRAKCIPLNGKSHS